MRSGDEGKPCGDRNAHPRGSQHQILAGEELLSCAHPHDRSCESLNRDSTQTGLRAAQPPAYSSDTQML